MRGPSVPTAEHVQECTARSGRRRPAPPELFWNTNSLIRTVPYVERTADRLRSGYGMNRAAGAGRPVRP